MDSNTCFEMKMNKENILKEGILELYFLGELSKAQEQEVFEILQSDKELMKQYKDLEKSMEKLAFENAIAPPGNVKEDILRQIRISDREQRNEPRIIQGQFYKRYFGIAASIAILFMTSSLILWMNLKETKQELKVTLSEKESIADSLNFISS